MDIVVVKIADMAVLKEKGLIITVGLGSCVGITLYDPLVKVGGLAHILLSDSRNFKNQNSFNHAKFADTAIPLLVKKIEGLGGNKNRLSAKIAGGSQLFSFQKTSFSIGEDNIFAVKKALQAINIPIKGEDVRGTHGRTMRFFIDSGKVIVSTVGKEEK
jgi:chemotaxis protein CheD